MSHLAGDALLQKAWVRPCGKHVLVVVGFERQDAYALELAYGLLRKAPRVGAVANGVACARKAHADGVGNIVGGREGGDVDAADVELVAMAHALDALPNQGAACSDGRCGGIDRPVEVLKHHRQAPHVVGVFVGNDDAANLA